MSPGIYQIVLSASDELDNTTSLPVTIEAFSPVPQIEDLSQSGTIKGIVSTYNPLEPVHFWRVRASEQPWLLDTNPTITTGGGIFSASGWIESRETISMSYAAGSTGSIDNRGIISLPPGQSVRILPMNGSNPMELQIIDQSGSLRYTHTLSVPRSTPIIDLNQI